MSHAGMDSPINMLLDKRAEDEVNNDPIADENRDSSFGSPSSTVQISKGKLFEACAQLC